MYLASTILCCSQNNKYLPKTGHSSVSAKCQVCAQETQKQGAISQIGVQMRGQDPSELWENWLYRDLACSGRHIKSTWLSHFFSYFLLINHSSWLVFSYGLSEIISTCIERLRNLKPRDRNLPMLVVFIDTFSRWLDVSPLRLTVFKKKFFQNLFPWFGLPLAMGSDHGSGFYSQHLSINR